MKGSVGGGGDGSEGRAWEDCLHKVLVLVQHSPSFLYISFQKSLCKVSTYQLLFIANLFVY